MGRFSRQKGKRGERQLVRFAQSVGIKAERRGHRQVSESVSDVWLPRTIYLCTGPGFALPETAVECKHESSTPIKGLKNALEQAGPAGQPRAVAIKCDGESDFYLFVKCADWSLEGFGIVARKTGAPAGNASERE